MAEFLTPEWLRELAAAAATGAAPDGVAVVIQQVVVEPDGSEVAYAVRVADGGLTVEPGRVDGADVTFTQDRATAEAISRGELSAQSAFLAGHLRVGGNLATVLAEARELSAIADVFGAARA